MVEYNISEDGRLLLDTLSEDGRLIYDDFFIETGHIGLQDISSLTAQEQGTYYAKLGSTILTNIEKDSFRITEELNKIPSFEFEIANCSDNRTAIAAGITDVLRIYRLLNGIHTLVFTGIANGDSIEYLSLERIRITGYASYIDLNWRFHQHLNSEDAENVDSVLVTASGGYAPIGYALYYDNSIPSYTNYTTEANNATIEDVQPSWDTVGDIFYLGSGAIFNDLKVKYSAEGIMGTAVLVYEYSKGSGVWGTLSCTDPSNKFTAIPGTYNITFTPPSDWATDTVDGKTNFWIRYRLTANAYDSNPLLDQIWTAGDMGDMTAAANNDTINDVTITFSNVNDALYIGQGEPFFGMQVKYSTKGVQAANTTVVWEYSEGSDVWSTLDILDETRMFTEDTGTYYITIPHIPSDWAKETVNSVKKFWIRARLTAGSYTTQPALDRIKITNVDVYRVYYFETAANTIMDEVLASTGYSMDATDTCPSDEISIVAEYETKLRIIAGVANALTWDDNGDKKAYQWWIDTSKKVHFKQKRGDTLGDITAELTILNNVEDYFNLSNRLHVFGNYDGLNQLRSVIEDTDSQDTHGIRELAVPQERYNNYIPLKEAAQKAMTYTKAPLQKIAATITTKYWLDNGFEVGDTVTLHKDTWNVDSTIFQIVRADIGPRVTNIDMGISQEHLDGLKAGLQRQLDITGIRMHGSTTLLQFGPETMNYHRVDDSTVYPARLKIEIPSDVRYIHKVLLSWTIGNYRAEVEPNTGPGSGHNHGGYAGSGGAFTPDVLDGGEHTPTELGKAHSHSIDQHITMYTNSVNAYVITSSITGYEFDHTHSNPSTGGISQSHTHTIPATDGPDEVDDAVIGWMGGSACATGYCVDYMTKDGFAVDTHWHLNTDKNTGNQNRGHTHTQDPTGGGGAHHHTLPTSAQELYVKPISAKLTITLTGDDDPAHIHTINTVTAHPHTGVAEGPHSDHVVTTEPGESVQIEYGIHEEAAGTTLELLVNSEVVASNYVGDQTDIRIDGYLSTGNNTVEIRPVVGENAKKGSCTTLASGIFFIEAKKF